MTEGQEGPLSQARTSGLLLSNSKMKGGGEPRLCLKLCHGGWTRILGPRGVVTASRPHPPPPYPVVGAFFRVTVSEMKMDRGRLWGKKNVVFFKNELKITSISRACLSKYLLLLPKQQPNTLRRINGAAR